MIFRSLCLFVATVLAFPANAETFFDKVDDYILEFEDAFLEERLFAGGRDELPEAIWVALSTAYDLPLDQVHLLMQETYANRVSMMNPLEIEHSIDDAVWGHGAYGPLVIIPFQSVALDTTANERVSLCHYRLVAEFDGIVFSSRLDRLEQLQVLDLAYPGVLAEMERLLRRQGGRDNPAHCQFVGVS